jgi:hypothetical protein
VEGQLGGQGIYQVAKGFLRQLQTKGDDFCEFNSMTSHFTGNSSKLDFLLGMILPIVTQEEALAFEAGNQVDRPAPEGL